MRYPKFLIPLLIIMMSACAITHKDAPVKRNIIPGWKLGYDYLKILDIALAQKDTPKSYALHSIDDPVLTANMIVDTWGFSWKGDGYEISESDYYIKVESTMGEVTYYKSLNYTIHSQDGKFMMELEKTDSSEGDVQFLVRAVNNGVAADILNSGELVHKTYEQLPAPYGCSNKKLAALKHREEFSYCTFGMDSLDITILRNKAMKENNLLKIMSKAANGAMTQMHLNQNMEVIYMASEGLEFKQCDISTALEER